jgi:hypothetical protein
MSDGISYFETNETFGSYNAVEWSTPGLTVVLDQVGLFTRILPADALPYFNAQVVTGHDIKFQVQVLHADGTTVVDLTGIPISFYAKLNQTDTTNLFSKTLAGNPLDILVPIPSNGIIEVFVRAADYASMLVGTTIFLYVDAVNVTLGNVNLGIWTLTITY